MALALRVGMRTWGGTHTERSTEHEAEQARALVLVADDHRRSRVRAALERDGHEVLATRSGRRAASFLKDMRRAPDVVVLDMRLPHQDGIEFAAAYRRAPAPHPPIILIPAPEQMARPGSLNDDESGPDNEEVESKVDDAALDLVRARVRLYGAQRRALRVRNGRTPFLVAAGIAAALVLGAAAAAPALAWG